MTTAPQKTIPPGLVVFRLADDVQPRSPHRWRIGHQPSGLAIADAMLREFAVAGAELLGTIADWTKDADELQAAIDGDDLFAKLSYQNCIAPASEPLPTGVDASSNGRYTDADIQAAAAEYKADGFSAFEILLDMAACGPWMGLDTDEFNDAHNRIAELADAA